MVHQCLSLFSSVVLLSNNRPPLFLFSFLSFVSSVSVRDAACTCMCVLAINIASYDMNPRISSCKDEEGKASEKRVARDIALSEETEGVRQGLHGRWEDR